MTCDRVGTPCSISPRRRQRRYLRESFGPWTRVWSQFRGCRATSQALTVLHAAARIEDGSVDEPPSIVVIDTHLARGAWNGGFTFHDRDGLYGRPRAPSASSPSM